MAIVLTNDENYKDIANAIRDRSGRVSSFRPDEMAKAILDIEGSFTEEELNRIAIKANTEGNLAIATDSAEWKNQGIEVYGQTEQVQTTGAQLLDFEDYEKVINGLTITIKNGVLKLIGTPTEAISVFLNLKNTVTELETGDYTLSVNDKKVGVGFSIETEPTSSLVIASSSSTPYKSGNVNNFKNNRIVLTITATVGALNNEYKIMLNEGSTAKPWEPYTGGQPSPSPDYPQEMISNEVSEIKFTGSQLFDVNTIKEVVIKDFGVRHGYEIILPTGYYTLSSESVESGYGLYLYLQIKSKDGSWGKIYYIVANVTPIKKTTLLEVKDGDIIYFYDAQGISAVDISISKSKFEKYDFMLNIGNAPLPYKAYEEQTVQLSAPITLRGIPVTSGGNVTIDGQQYISDIIKEKDGVYGVERHIQEDLIDGVNISVYGVSKPSWAPELVDHSVWGLNLSKHHSKGGLNKILLCDILKYYYNNSNYEHIYVNEDMSKAISIIMSDARLNTIDASGANEWLKQNTTKVAYKVAEPTFEALPEADQEAIRKLMTYYPTTVLDAGAWSKLNYVADPKNYIDGLAQDIKQIKADIVKLGGR